MTRTLVAALLTLGDPARLTDGYLFHRRIATIEAPAVLRRTRRSGASALVVDSIGAALLGPWIVLRPPALPVLGMLQQPPGGIDYGPPRSMLQAYLDRLANRRARILTVAS
jgi:hypothetical protein